MKRTTIHVCTKDRPSELALLLQSLRTQTYQAWDLLILDDGQNDLSNNYFIQCLLNRIKIEGHYVHVYKNKTTMGVCFARNKCIEIDYFDNPYNCRLDDDVILDPDYLEKLLKVISKGYDIASGVTPMIGQSDVILPVEVDKLNVKKFNKQGDIIKYGDDCGYQYSESKILPADEFRSCALMKKKVTDIISYPNNLSPTGFREEAFFSLSAKWKGFKIGVHTQAIVWHFATPSGGVRSEDYQQRVNSDNTYFFKWAKKMYKEHGDLK